MSEVFNSSDIRVEKDPASKDWFATKDLGLAAALQALDMFPQNLEQERPPKGPFWMYFEHPTLCSEYAAKYFDENLDVSALKYNNAITNLKARIYDEKTRSEFAQKQAKK